jgi:hypothetical protein
MYHLESENGSPVAASCKFLQTFGRTGAQAAHSLLISGSRLRPATFFGFPTSKLMTLTSKGARSKCQVARFFSYEIALQSSNSLSLRRKAPSAGQGPAHFVCAERRYAAISRRISRKRSLSGIVLR